MDEREFKFVWIVWMKGHILLGDNTLKWRKSIDDFKKNLYRYNALEFHVVWNTANRATTSLFSTWTYRLISTKVYTGTMHSNFMWCKTLPPIVLPLVFLYENYYKGYKVFWMLACMLLFQRVFAARLLFLDTDSRFFK